MIIDLILFYLIFDVMWGIQYIKIRMECNMIFKYKIIMIKK